MQERHWQSVVISLLVLGTMSLPVIAATNPTDRAGAHHASSRFGKGGFVGHLEKEVGLTPEQSDAVRGLLAEQREVSRELREKTDAKIRVLLNEDQQKKFDRLLAAQKDRNRSRQGA